MPVHILIETLPGRASDVAQHLMSVPGLMLRCASGDSRLEGTWAARDGEPLERLWELLVLDPEVLEGHPTEPVLTR